MNSALEFWDCPVQESIARNRDAYGKLAQGVLRQFMRENLFSPFVFDGEQYIKAALAEMRSRHEAWDDK